jgi:penicillin-binding protein 1A
MSFSSRRIRRSHHQRLPIAVVSVLVLSVFALGVLAVAAWVAVTNITTNLPDLNAPLPPLANTTKIFAADGTLLTDLYYSENRVPISVDALPKVLVDAVVAAEDERFFSHRGVDFMAIGRALVADLRAGRVVEGGSTITEQFVKNVYGQRARTMRRKVREALMAYRLEQIYPKKLILERYLNTIYLGQSAYGVEAGARMYFGHSARRVTLPEAATLAGIIRSPNNDSPYASPKVARERRDTVLDQMAKQGLITTAQATSAKRTPLRVLPPHAAPGKAPYFVDYVKRQLISQYGADTVFKCGLRVRTTLDPKLQRLAERAAWGILDQKGDPSVALVAIDPRTGAIKAMVGGRDFSRLSYNLATQAHRQPGSSFKPFVLATALSEGHSLDSLINSDPGTLEIPGGGTWSVSNATEGSGGGLITLHDATVESVNAVFARLILDVGADQVVSMAQRLGITTTLHPDPAIALGGLRQGVTPLEMASAFGTFATGGVHAQPTAIAEVQNVPETQSQPLSPSPEPVLDKNIAALINSTLHDVIQSGTGRNAQISVPAAGKTGTTQSHRDAWFIGYTPRLVTSVWVGYPRERSMDNVHGRLVWGGTFPAEIWASFMEAAVGRLPAQQFAGVEKGGLVKVRICSQSGLLATQFCPRTIMAEFALGHAPKRTCPLHAKAPPRPVPNVVGMTVAQATAVLTGAGFAPVTAYTDSNVAAGVVIWQNPASGKKAEPGSQVGLAVSSGSGQATGQPPKPAMSISNQSPAAGETVVFDGSASSDPGGKIVRYEWSFGDGGKAAGAVARHKYLNLGTYAVTLTVYNDKGLGQSVDQRVIVNH